MDSGLEDVLCCVGLHSLHIEKKIGNLSFKAGRDSGKILPPPPPK